MFFLGHEGVPVGLWARSCSLDIRVSGRSESASKALAALKDVRDRKFPHLSTTKATHRSRQSTQSQIPSSMTLPSVTLRSVSAWFKALRGVLTESRCTKEASKFNDVLGRSLRDLMWLPQQQEGIAIACGTLRVLRFFWILSCRVYVRR